MDEKGARIVRLASFVWQLVGAGAFEQGVMSASVVSEVAFCSVVLMSLLAEIRLANPNLRFILEGCSLSCRARRTCGTEERSLRT